MHDIGTKAHDITFMWYNVTLCKTCRTRAWKGYRKNMFLHYTHGDGESRSFGRTVMHARPAFLASLLCTTIASTKSHINRRS